MIHNYIKDDLSGDHWGVSSDGQGNVLLQIQEEGVQTRISVSTEIAYQIAARLREVACAIYGKKMSDEMEGVPPLVGPLDSSKMGFTWKTVENGKVTSCLGPVCKDCTCGYVEK